MTSIYCGLLSDEFHTFFDSRLFEFNPKDKNAQLWLCIFE